MKYNDTLQILKTAIKVIQDPMFIANKLGESEVFQFTKNLDLNNAVDNNIYEENESSNIEVNKSVPIEDNMSFDNNKGNGHYNNQKYTSSDSQGIIDSITQEMTPVRLQQAIILSEIVGKPRSKTRQKRRF